MSIWTGVAVISFLAVVSSVVYAGIKGPYTGELGARLCSYGAVYGSALFMVSIFFLIWNAL